MNIRNSVLQDIYKTMPSVPPEIGGMIGGKNNIVTVYFKDIGVNSYGCSYSPNVKILW